jgi:hypothetical protein
MNTTLNTKLTPEQILKLEKVLDKKPIGQDKLENAKKLVEKGVLTIENLNNVKLPAKK